MVPTPCVSTKCSWSCRGKQAWDTNGIDGCHRFLKKFWGLFYENRTDNFLPSADEAAKPESLKSVHKLIKKVSEDIEKFSYNTSISAS